MRPRAEGEFFRACQKNEMDNVRRDRFRIELTQDSVSVYVNGKLYLQQSGLAAKDQLPEPFLSSDLYVYFSNWTNRPLGDCYVSTGTGRQLNPIDASGEQAAAFGIAPFQAPH